MKGLTLAEGFYREYGEPMLREQFPALMDKIAVGLVGSGSECFGFDDQISRDHDFEPGFCLFLPGEEQVDRTAAFALERAYEKLPKEYRGFTRSPIKPVGGNRHGVLRLADFLTEKTGTPDGLIEGNAWFFLPEQALAEVTNGQLFWDGSGDFTAIRQRLSYLPKEVCRKKLAGHLLLMGQAGQYNHPRCIARGEYAAARLAVNEFVNSALHAAFLLEKKYLPYYKWQFRALRALPMGTRLSASLEQLLAGGLTPAETDRLIGAIAAVTAEAVQAQGLSALPDRELERLAYAVNNGIGDAELRNLHILYGV
ncbi:MAG: DUF4037 domain-containing protein [Clostridia bacterium]|nr:DUF4037 domain-containing protein [Clostridia bacterium]